MYIPDHIGHLATLTGELLGRWNFDDLFFCFLWESYCMCWINVPVISTVN